LPQQDNSETPREHVVSYTPLGKRIDGLAETFLNRRHAVACAQQQ
jgi:hypothetical protein